MFLKLYFRNNYLLGIDYIFRFRFLIDKTICNKGNCITVSDLIKALGRVCHKRYGP